VYNSWNEGSIAWQEQSSDIQDDELLYSDGSQIEDGSSDYDPMKDPDADGLKTAHLPTGRTS
jgi:chitinase